MVKLNKEGLELGVSFVFLGYEYNCVHARYGQLTREFGVVVVFTYLVKRAFPPCFSVLLLDSCVMFYTLIDGLIGWSSFLTISPSSSWTLLFCLITRLGVDEKMLLSSAVNVDVVIVLFDVKVGCR